MVDRRNHSYRFTVGKERRNGDRRHYNNNIVRFLTMPFNIFLIRTKEQAIKFLY